ncbi:hypothetical protein DPMN_149028 [Dreissena polymorpha]|uniref:Uncharacterized protein n=1 Tax=Dreissena polymorpha TaxID=45954 RepID=A0A9D4FAN3_DREPO|nr:hypothetical protein DPMN_149028 [Dreissena polymorpha]
MDPINILGVYKYLLGNIAVPYVMIRGTTRMHQSFAECLDTGVEQHLSRLTSVKAVRVSILMTCSVTVPKQLSCRVAISVLEIITVSTRRMPELNVSLNVANINLHDNTPGKCVCKYNARRQYRFVVEPSLINVGFSAQHIVLQTMRRLVP